MYFDNLTIAVTLWGAAIAVAIVVISACDGCCIAKIRGRACKK